MHNYGCRIFDGISVFPAYPAALQGLFGIVKWGGIRAFAFLHIHPVGLEHTNGFLIVAIGQWMSKVCIGTKDGAAHLLCTFYLFTVGVSKALRTVNRGFYFFEGYCTNAIL